MHIGLLTADFAPTSGGVAEFLRSLCRGVDYRGGRVCVVAPECEHGEQGRWDLVEYRKSPRISSLAPLRAVASVCRRKRVRFLLLGHVMSTHGLGALYARWRHGICYGILVHGFDLEYSGLGSIDRWSMKMLFDNASVIFTNSAYTRGEVLTAFPGSQNRLALLPPGIDAERFSPGSPADEILERWGLRGKRVILTVGRLVRRKGHRVLLEALPQVLARVPECVYVVAGNGPEMATLQERVRELGLSANVRFVGRVPSETLPELYRSCDVFAMPLDEGSCPSDKEGFGIVFLEAGACAKPVVTGRCGGIADAVEEGRTGLLVDPENPGNLADALTHLLLDRDLREKLGKAGRERVLESFTEERLAERFLEAVDRVLMP